jgi:hypothetical protein
MIPVFLASVLPEAAVRLEFRLQSFPGVTVLVCLLACLLELAFASLLLLPKQLIGIDSLCLISRRQIAVGQLAF